MYRSLSTADIPVFRWIRYSDESGIQMVAVSSSQIFFFLLKLEQVASFGTKTKRSGAELKSFQICRIKTYRQVAYRQHATQPRRSVLSITDSIKICLSMKTSKLCRDFFGNFRRLHVVVPSKSTKMNSIKTSWPSICETYLMGKLKVNSNFLLLQQYLITFIHQ